MTTVTGSTETRFDLERTYATDVPELNEPWPISPVASPQLLVLNEELAESLGLDPDALRRDAVDVLAGNAVPAGAEPVAQAYAGHQFGGYSPRLGDGRALMLGELVAPDGRRFDLQLKGSGRTPFARGGDGRAAVGPMLREYVFGEAMHALGVPTTRMLSVVGTGETVRRDRTLPGAVLTRVAASHLRIGTFQFAAATGDRDVLERLLDHAVRRHHPAALDRAGEDGGVALGFFDAVVETQINTVARWMALGFVHGVMNTDNVTISGETIDFGPCAFMDVYEPTTVFSSIDHGGRYAYGNQPPITAWNLARLAETLLPLMHDDQDRSIELATEVLDGFGDRFAAAWRGEVAAKLGLTVAELDATRDDSGTGLDDLLLSLFHAHRVDWTSGWRSLSRAVRGDPTVLADLGEAFDEWRTRWFAAIDATGRSRDETATAMDAVNPVYIVRNHLVEEALATASDDGDFGPFERLVSITTQPFEEHADAERYAQPAPAGSPRHVTFCGT